MENATDAAVGDVLGNETRDAAVSDGPAEDGATIAPIACDAAAGAMAVGDGATSGSHATNYFVLVATLRNGLCLPQSLPIDGAGHVLCQVFFALVAGDTCIAHAGLTPAALDVAASLRNTEQVPPSQPICVLAQLPGTDGVCGSCATSSQAGWCYVTGAAAGKCLQTIVVSPSSTTPTGAIGFLGCGTTSSPSAVVDSVASVGTPCLPSSEASASFAGFNYHEVTLDGDNAACAGAVCLVNHFQGLTDCPYGQDASGGAPPSATSPCTVPGTSAPVRPNDPVARQTILPQCLDRRASKTVYCSCRCANVEGGTNDGSSYCTCPSGYACTQVVPAIESGDPRAGAYCVQSGTAYDPSTVCSSECDATQSNCP